MQKIGSLCVFFNNNTNKIKPYDTTNTSRLIPPFKEDLQMIFYQSQVIASIEPEDVKQFIRQLKRKKTPGKSGITNKMLKKVTKYLYHISN